MVLFLKAMMSLIFHGDIKDYLIMDYKNIINHRKLTFEDKGTILGKTIGKLLTAKPGVEKEICVGCGKCASVCPANAIRIENNLPIIDRKKCIKCFCCQEFCPKGAMKVKRTFVAKMLTK